VAGRSSGTNTLDHNDHKITFEKSEAPAPVRVCDDVIDVIGGCGSQTTIEAFSQTPGLFKPRTPEDRAKAAVRAKRWRERQRRRRRSLLVDVPDSFESTLVDRGLLRLGEVDDPHNLAAKAAEIIERWIDDA
jgi:hypothetical protein